MKIYATRRDSSSELAKYVGKDVWILCYLLIKGSRISKNKFWIRFIEDKGTSYDVNIMLAGTGEDFTTQRGIREADHYLNTIRNKKKNEIQLAEPIEICTTEELFSLPEEEYDI